MTTPLLRPTFGERYRKAHRLQDHQCAEHLLGRSLHAPLRWVWPVARKLCRYHFENERLSLQTIMQLRSQHTLKGELAELFFLPTNRKLHRRLFRLRISTRRVRELLQNLPPL